MMTAMRVMAVSLRCEIAMSGLVERERIFWSWSYMSYLFLSWAFLIEVCGYALIRYPMIKCFQLSEFLQ